MLISDLKNPFGTCLEVMRTYTLPKPSYHPAIYSHFYSPRLVNNCHTLHLKVNKNVLIGSNTLCGDHIYTSLSDVCRRQILTYKDGAHTGNF